MVEKVSQHCSQTVEGRFVLGLEFAGDAGDRKAVLKQKDFDFEGVHTYSFMLAIAVSNETRPILHETWRQSSRKLTNRGVTFNSLSFGRRLKSAFKGAKNAEIARVLGVSESAVSNYVGGRVPDAETLIAIRNFTNCDLDWLLTGEEKAQPVEVDTIFDEEKLFEKVRIIVREEMLSTAAVQELGTVDEFDIASAVKKYDNAVPVLREWYAHDKLPMPHDLSEIRFAGWDRMTIEQKVKEVTAVRRSIDQESSFKDVLKASTAARPPKKKI